MAHRERQAWLQLACSLLLCGVYGAVLWAGLRLESIGWAVPVAVLIALLGVAFVADRGAQPEDERDRLIRYRATSVFAMIVYLGSVLMVWKADGIVSPAPINSALLMCLVFGAGVIGALVKLYLYRRA